MGVAVRWAQAVFALFIWLFAASAMAQGDGPDGSRVALVIGNSAYDAVTALPNPTGDAGAVAESFRRLGFEVTQVEDADYFAMRRAIQDFEIDVATAEIAVVFYAGHGIEIAGDNYLIPTDAQLARDTHVLDEAIPLSRVLTAVERASRLGLVILDACRDNPFAAQMQMSNPNRSVGRGLALVEPEGSILIAYAAREGTVADDGDGDHSPYTTALLAHLETPGLEISFLFRQVRDDVIELTGGQQEPFVYGTLGGAPIYFMAAAEAPPIAQTPPIADQQVGGASVLAAYEAAVAIDTVEAWDAFLRYFPTGYFAELARAARNKLTDPMEQILGPDILVVADVPADDPLDAAAIPPLAAFPPPAAAPAVDAEPPPLLGGQPASSAEEDVVALCDRLASYRFDTDRPADVEGVPFLRLSENYAAALEACEAAVEAHPDIRRLHYQLARVYIVLQRNEDALASYRRAADLGSGAAMNEIGLAYGTGTTVVLDPEAAADWFRRGAEAGNTDAMINLGNAYDAGEGVPLDLAEAGRLFRQAADLGHPEGMANIGYRFQYGRGEPLDYEEARRWYLMGAEAGSSFAMLNIGYLSDWGQGGPVDYPAARMWYEQSADLGNSYAISNLGYMYENGRGVGVDLERAKSLYEEAAAAGNEYGMFNLGRLYQDSIGVTQDYNAAFNWYRQAAEAGHTYAMNRLGIMYDNGWGVTADPVAARDWWETAADAGIGDALHNLGYLYETGRGVTKDMVRASQYYVGALELRNAATIDEFLSHSGSYTTDIRRAVEAFLIDRGLLDGTADGVFDSATRDALNALAAG